MAAVGPIAPVVGGEGIEEPEVPGPLLDPYFQMLLADDPTDGPRAGHSPF